MATLRERLGALGWLGIPGADEAIRFMGDAPMSDQRPVITDDGRLFVLCSGNVLFSFSRDDGLRGCVYLVIDTGGYSQWIWKRAQGKEIHEIGAAPSQTLKLVVSI